MKKYILTIIAGVFLLTGNAQKADALYNHLSLQEAINLYESKLEKNSTDGEAIYNLANAYRLNNESVKAELWFAKAVERSEQIDAKFYYAQMLLMNGKPSKAKEWFNNYKLNIVGKETQHIDGFIELCTQMENDNVPHNSYDIKKAIFNSESLDFSPSYYGEDLLFVSNRDESQGASNNLDHWTNEKYTDLYITYPKSGFEVEPFSKVINSNLHESSGVFSNGLDTLYFTRSNQLKGNITKDSEMNVRLQIMESTKNGEKWSKPKKLSFNNDNFSYCHPTLSKDDSTMIFASDQPGGFGGMDLYIVKREGNGWGIPENMGEKINTTGNEVFPFLDDKGKLYFSSNFHPGFGGLDIFESSQSNGVWSKPTNVGIPLNSVKDDFAVITQDNFKTGYFSSHRTGDDEIYTFKNKGNYIIKGRVINCITEEAIAEANVNIYEEGFLIKNVLSDEDGWFSIQVNENMGELRAVADKNLFITNDDCPGELTFDPNEEVELLLALTSQYDPNSNFNLCGTVLNSDCNYLLDNAKIKIINICNGDVAELTSDKDGKFRFPLMKNCKYKVIVEKEHFTTVQEFVTTDSIPVECLDLDIVMYSDVDLRDPENGYAPTNNNIVLKEGTVVDLYNVYFDLDKYNIRRDAIEELEWVKKILEDYPEMTVEISAHTDSRASDEYNIRLSKNRANSVRQYLVDAGIDGARISSVGYGETRLKNECADGVYCDELKHQRNRRVEFKVLKFKGKAIVSKEWKAYVRN